MYYFNWGFPLIKVRSCNNNKPGWYGNLIKQEKEKVIKLSNMGRKLKQSHEDSRNPQQTIIANII